MTVVDTSLPTGRPIYLDHHATTPVDPRVATVVLRHMTEEFGNPHSSDHVFGDHAAEAVERSAGEVASLVGGRSEGVIWTSGATEAINLALQGCAERHASAGRLRIVASPTEHAAVIGTCEALVRAGRASLRFLGVDRVGRVDLDEIEAACHAGADLLCVMAANNEVGTIAPVSEVATLAARHGVAYLCDATQAAGRIELNADRDGVTFVAFSAHKMYGPKGVGALVTTSRRILAPLIHGGEQQKGLRAGTLNVPGIAGFGLAAALRMSERESDEAAIGSLRDELQLRLLAELPGQVQVNGDTENRLACNLHVSFTGCPNTTLIARIRHDLAVATGSACSSGVDAPSHVLRAMGLSPTAQEGAIRIGLGKSTTLEEVDRASVLLVDAVRDATRSIAGIFAHVAE